jgi:hypothetical protein
MCSIFKLAKVQFSDEGCSSSLNTWRKDVKRRKGEEEKAKKIAVKVLVNHQGLLYEMLVKQKKSYLSVSKILKTYTRSVRYASELLGFPELTKKKRCQAEKKLNWEKKGLTKMNLTKLYHVEKNTLVEIAKMLGVGKDAVIEAMKVHGINRRHKMNFRGVNTSVYAPEKEIQWIEEIASRENKSQSEIIREGIQLVIKKYAQA